MLSIHIYKGIYTEVKRRLPGFFPCAFNTYLSGNVHIILYWVFRNIHRSPLLSSWYLSSCFQYMSIKECTQKSCSELLVSSLVFLTHIYSGKHTEVIYWALGCFPCNFNTYLFRNSTYVLYWVLRNIHGNLLLRSLPLSLCVWYISIQEYTQKSFTEC